MVDLYPHQHRGLAKIRSLQGKSGVFAEMGLGKSRIALTHLLESKASKILIISPLAGASVWRREVKLVDMPHRFIDTTRQPTSALKAVAVRRAGPMTIVSCNYESYWREPLRSEIARWQPDAVVIDEAHRIRNRTTRQARYAHYLADRPYVLQKLALTGTPMANGPQDLWSLFRFINPTVFGTWRNFDATYLLHGGYFQREITGYQNIDQLRRLVDENSFQCTKEEAALNLPPRQDVQIKVPLSPGTRRVYNELKKQALVEIENANGETSVVVARIVLTMIIRLQQIANGFARNVGEEIVDLSDEKAKVTADLISDAVIGKQKVVVFCRYLHDIDKLSAQLEGYRVARLDGSVTGKKRDAVRDEFASGAYDVLLAQTKVASESIDLTSATVGIFYSTGYSLIDFLQARDRIHRIGQTRPVTYYHILAERTVDETVYAALSQKVNIAGQVTNLSYARGLFTADAEEALPEDDA